MENVFHPFNKQQRRVQESGQLETTDDLQQVVHACRIHHTPVYVRVRRRLGHSVTRQTLFGFFASDIQANHTIHFRDVDNDVERLIPIDHLLTITTI